MRIAYGLLLSFAAAAPAMAQLPPPVPPATMPAHCTAEEFGQLDFWIGTWDVYNTEIKDEMRGMSIVDKAFNGCVVREDWHPFTMLTGGSFNSWDRNAKVWRQAWVDSMGGVVNLSGTFKGGKLVMTGESSGLGGVNLNRMTIWPKGDTVRQIVEFSKDGGKTWEPSVDFTYKRRKPQQ